MINHIGGRNSPAHQHKFTPKSLFRNSIIKFILIALFATLLALGLSSCFLAGGNSYDTKTIASPQDANLINIKQYGAVGDGVTDDTEAIRQAVKDNLNQHKTLFFPAGTYLISDIIEWKLDNGIFYAFLTWQGEGIGKTIIKLKDNTIGYNDPESPKPITRPGSSDFGGTGGGNQAMNNYIFDMTFDTGKGNPGAIGVDFTASNAGAMENVEIISEDGQGFAGLELTREVGPCLIKNVTIKGFDVGILGGAALIHVTLEDIHLENQNVVGIENTNLVMSIRHLTSNNSVPAFKNIGDWKGPVVLIDSELRGGSSQVAAIKNLSNIVVRNVKTEGYKTAIQHNNKFVPGSYVEEFVSEKPLSLFESPPKTLNIPIEETPVFVDNDLKNWANVETYGAKSDDDLDDSEGIQKAINSGKNTIYFPQGIYKIDRPITVKGNVQRLIGFNSQLESQLDSNIVMFRFNNDKYPVVFERFNFFKDGILENAASQPVVIRHTIGPTFLTTSDSGTWFIEDVATSRFSLNQNQKIYARQLNLESPPPEPLLKNDGGLAWILGYKTEYGNTVSATLNGCMTEILGGLFYP
ncbi:MAG: glycosyl hydrolase family 28-related protein, partial [Waterburya sp.]